VERIACGVLAGLIGGLPVGALTAYQNEFTEWATSVLPGWATFAAYVVVTGALIGAVVGYRPRAVAVAACVGVLFGLIGWLVWPLTVIPAVQGHTPTWSAAAAAASYRELVGNLLHGGVVGVLLQGLLAVWVSRPRDARPVSVAAPRPRVVIVGGGFAGVSVARRLEHRSLRGRPADVTLISSSNYLLFTPMLAEVASGALEPAHISAPVRAAIPNTRFQHGTVDAVDTRQRVVRVDTGSGPPQVIPYDHLVLAVGSVPHFMDLPGVAEHSLTLKNLDDAMRLRNHVITMLESADQLPAGSPARTALLSFVVAGGGFAGAETVAELFDLVHGVLHFYPRISPDEVRFTLVNSGRILPELSEELSEYALRRLAARTIEFRLGVRVAGATAWEVHLGNGERLATRTFVWTAGNRPGPLVARLGGEHARNGALVTDAAFRVVGLDGVWAVGDCAQIPDPDSGGSYPPTAQHALREGKALADNIAAVIGGRAPAPFRFRTIGLLVVLGHRTAAAEIRGLRFSGLVAWLMWRGIYLSKLPGAEKRLRVLFDWMLDLAFPRDIVLTTPSPQPARPRQREMGV
jgi:NADH dehydrogenase